MIDSRLRVREVLMSNLGEEEVEPGNNAVPGKRYFKSQKSFQGNCLVLALNNALGETVVTTAELLARVKSGRAPGKRVPFPARRGKFLSLHLLVEAINSKRMRLTKVGNLRTPKEKFAFLLSADAGRFLVMTNVASKTQKRGTHDLNAREEQHWIAVSSDEKLVIDSLARNVGPQQLSEITLRRSTRAGIVKIYSIERLAAPAL